MTSKITYQEEQRVCSILMMRFNLDPYQSLKLVEGWLAKHEKKSHQDLERYLLAGEIIYSEEKLEDISRSRITAISERMRGKNGLKLKNRWYNFKLYRQCFRGSESVLWLMENEEINEREAIQLGQILIDRKIICSFTETGNFYNSDFWSYYFCPNKIQKQNKAISQTNNWDKLLAN